MRKFILALFLCLAAVAHAETHIFIIDGQSNSSGRGLLSQVPTYANANRIYLYDNAGNWRLATEPTDSAVGEVEVVTRDDTAGAGYAMAFANRMAELYPGDNIGIVQCSKGSSSVSTFRRFYTNTSRHGVCLNRAKAASQYGTIRGLVWWQFEADTLSAAAAGAWRENVSNVWAALRADLGILNLPIVFAQANSLPKASTHPFWATLRATQSQIVSPNITMVPTDGIVWQADKVHATTAGYQVIGVRFANAMYELLN
jgi:hypothetical protein